VKHIFDKKYFSLKKNNKKTQKHLKKYFSLKRKNITKNNKKKDLKRLTDNRSNSFRSISK